MPLIKLSSILSLEPKMTQKAPWETETACGSSMTCCPLCESSDIGALFPSIWVWKCAKCGMIFRNPQPTEEELSNFYNKAFRPENVAAHTTGMAGTTHSLARQYVSYLSRKIGVKRKRVLEFGAGLGNTCRALRECGADVTAIEPFAWKECRNAGITTCRSLDELPESSKFDVIIALEVIEHLRSPWLNLRQLQSRLQPGGWLYAATPNAGGLRARLHGAQWGELTKYGHLLFYTSGTLELALKKAGFARCARVRSHVRHSRHPGKVLAHYALQSAGLDGDLRYLAQTA